MKISIIIVEYHSLLEIKKCVSSIRNYFQAHNYEIIISSNSCYSLPKIQQIQDEDKDIVWCINDLNGGFAYAMNSGLKIATGDILIITNPDVVFEAGIIQMAKFLQNTSYLGAVAPKILDDLGNIQDSCRNYITLPSFCIRNVIRLIRRDTVILDKNIDLHKIQTVDWVIGAFIMVKREAYEITQGLDHKYFLYCEDLDWCTRIRKAGFEIAYYPQAIIRYTGSRRARESLKYTMIFLKSLFRYWNKFGYFKISPNRKPLSIFS
ncbi:MAG: glycosyltransferase family 2 protein [Bacteroidales bacterium]